MLSVTLQAKGYEVFTAANGQEGLEKVENARPNLIVLDVMMPVMDGFAFFKQVRGNPDKYAKPPIVMLTVRSKMRDTFEALEADAFLPKPFMVAELLTTVEKIFAPQALVLSSELFATEKITGVLAKSACAVDVVESEEDLLRKAGEKKYRLIIAHLSLIKKGPDDFMRSLKSVSGENRPEVVIYSDTNVPGLEKENLLAIDSVKNIWMRAGMRIFYDRRFTERTFPDIIKNILG